MSSFGTAQGWLAIGALALGTFAIRYSFLGWMKGRGLSKRSERLLALAVPAIFAALVVPLIVMNAGRLDLAVRWPHVVAAVAAGAWALWRGGMAGPLLIGMGTLHLLLFFF